MINQLKGIYQYREMIWMLVRRDLRGRYKASFLGFLWTFLNPLLQLFVYTLVFSVILRNNIEKYFLFLFVALIPWMFFSTSVAGGCTCVVNQQDMVTKIYFPREVLPVAHVTTNFVNMLYTFVVVFIVTVLCRTPLTPLALLCLPVVMAAEYMLALGLTLIVSALTVYVRDLEHIVSIIIMAWQFLTPVMYSLEQVPIRIKPVFQINPMTNVIVAYRDVLYYGRVPELRTLGSSYMLGAAFLILGTLIFTRLQRRFAEEL